MATQSYSQELTNTGLPEPASVMNFELPQFSSSLGQLIEVTLSFSSSASGTIGPPDGGGWQFGFTLTGPGVPSPSPTVGFDSISDIVFFAGAGAWSSPLAGGLSLGALSAGYASYVGNGSIGLPVDSSEWGAGATDATANGVTRTIDGTLSITYHYTPSGGEHITLRSGHHTVALSGSNNTVAIGNGNNTVSGGQDDNTITIGNGNSTVSLSGGANSVTLGNGNGTVSLGGGANTVTLGNGTDTVHGGTGDTINLANTTLNIFGTDEMVFVGKANSTVDDFSTGLDLRIGPTAGKDVLSNFASDSSGIVDLLGGIGGFKTTSDVLSALKSDGHGGTLLSFGGSGSLDFVEVASSHLHASNFQIG